MALQVAECVARDEFDYSTDPLNFITTGSTLPSTHTRIPQEFTITTDSYISLCSRVYAVCCSLHSDFANDISESMFIYYAVFWLWTRFADILPWSEKNGSEFFTDIKLTRNKACNYYIPLPLQTYLKGIGYYRDPDSCDRRFLLPILPTDEKISGVSYTFGRVNAKTHFFYEALPAPGIMALRLQADIRYTKDASEKNFLWDLPEGLRPDIQELLVLLRFR